MDDEKILLEETGPNGNVQAIVEAAHGVVYFYLWSNAGEEPSMKAVWVRNLVPAPETLDVEAMKEDGRPPLNPAICCKHPQGAPPLESDQLNVVWLPEGNGAALCEANKLLAIIPPWSGIDGFDGYARDQIGEGPIAHELLAENVLLERFRQAKAYWKKAESGELWQYVQKTLLAQLEKSLGKHSKYFAIDGGEWPTKGMLLIPSEEGTVLVTLGVSIRPQPNVELDVEDPQPLRRIELGAILPKNWSEDEIMTFASYLSGQTTYPWAAETWLGPLHTVPCDHWKNKKFTEAMLIESHPVAGELTLGPILGDPVTILWYLPITPSEMEQAMEHGSESVLSSISADRWKQA